MAEARPKGAIISMPTRYRSFHALLLLAVTFPAGKPLAADSVPVLRSQGTFHGFLVLQTLDGKSLATGDLIQIGEGDRVTSRLTFHFRDGSLDDETTVYTQHKVFHLISDHHIQRGPSFPQPLDMLVEAATHRSLPRDSRVRLLAAPRCGSAVVQARDPFHHRRRNAWIGRDAGDLRRSGLRGGGEQACGGGGIGDEEAHFFEARGVVAHQIL